MQVREEERSGWRAVVLDGGALRVTVLPDKGADLYELVDVASGVDVLFKAPWGLAPPGAPPREGAGGHAFLESYEGGWQELLPNTNDPCRYRGRELPFHGEVCSLPWSCEPLALDGAVGLRLSVDCRLLPLRVERVLRIAEGSRRLEWAGTVSNQGEEDCDLVWGHHCVLGPPFLHAGCR